MTILTVLAKRYHAVITQMSRSRETVIEDRLPDLIGAETYDRRVNHAATNALRRRM